MELSLSFTIFYNDCLAGGRLRHRKRIDVDDSREGEDASSLTAVSTMM